MKNIVLILFLFPAIAKAQISDIIKQHNIAGILHIPTVATNDSSLNAANTAWVKRQLYGTGGGGTWGSITGTLSAQTDLQNALNLKLNISDTAAMLLPYLRKTDTAAMLSRYFRQNGNSFGALATFGTTDANAIQFIANSANVFRVLSTGEVLIGATTTIGGSGNTKFQVDVLSQAYFGGNVYIGAAPVSTTDRLTVTGTARITGNARINDMQLLTNGTASTTGDGISVGNTGSEMNFQVNPGGVKPSFDYRYWTGTTGTFGATGSSTTDKILISVGNGNAGNDSQRVNTLSFRHVLNQTASFANIRFRGIYFNPVLTSLTNTTNTFILQISGENKFNAISGNTAIGLDSNATAGAKLHVNGTVRLDAMLVGTSTSPVLVKDADSVIRQVAQSSLTGTPNIGNTNLTLNGTRTLSGATNTLQLGTSGSKISTLTVNTSSAFTVNSDANIKLFGGLILKQVTTSDADYNVSITDIAVRLKPITANRTLTFGSPGTDTGRVLILINQNNNSNVWLTSDGIYNSLGSSVSQLDNGTTYFLQWVGDGSSGKWTVISQTGTPPTFGTSSGTLSLVYNTWSEQNIDFQGSTSTFTLPQTSGNRNGFKFYIKNAGSGNVTVSAFGGTNDIYDVAATSSITITPGTARVLTQISSIWYVQ